MGRWVRCTHRFLILLLCLSVSSVATAEENSWNQWNESPSSGVSQGHLKVSLGAMYNRALKENNFYLLGQWEYFLHDHFAVLGESGLPVSTGFEDRKTIPALVGGNIHLLPRRPFNVFLGGLAGYTYMAFTNLPSLWSPTVGGHLGISVYYWGLYFVQLEGGYLSYSYASSALYEDHGALRVTYRGGFYF